MLYTNPMHTQMEPLDAIVRALSSLNARDVEAVRASVRAEGDHYRVEQHLDYDGYLSLLLTAQDDDGRAFLVSGRTDAIELFALAGDEMRALGVYAGVAAAMAALQPALDEHDWRLSRELE